MGMVQKMNATIMVAIACHNRRLVAELCLPTMRDSLTDIDMLLLCNDGSTEYDTQDLEHFREGDMLTILNGCYPPIGIQEQRKAHLRFFLNNASAATHLYLTDHDCIHDPLWRTEALRFQAKYNGLPLCLYNTQAHVRLPGNTIEDKPDSEVIIRQVAPGVSYFLTRAHVEQLASYIDGISHFDWQIPAMLGGRFAVSRVGYCDHIGWGGRNHPENEDADGGDRVLAPTQFLIEKRAEIVSKLKGAN